MKKQSIFSAAITLILLLFINSNAIAQACPGSQTCIYVSTAGNDSNDGSSEQQAYRNIQTAINNAGPGYTIRVLPGTYYEHLVFDGVNGARGQQLWLTSYKGTAILDGSNSTTNDPMIRIKNGSFITIAYLTIQNNVGPYASGIKIEGGGTYVEVQYSKIKNIGWEQWSSSPSTPSGSNQANPLVVLGNSTTANKELLIRDNEILECATGNSEGLTITGNVDNFIVLRNKVHHITNIGIDIAGSYDWVISGTSVSNTQNRARNGRVEENEVYNCVHPNTSTESAGIYVDGGVYIKVGRNKSYNNGSGFSIGCEECTTGSNKESFGNILRNNWAYNNVGPAVVLGSHSGRDPINDIGVSNNTFYKNYKKGGSNDGVEIRVQNCTDCKVKQNIIIPDRSNDVGIGLWGYTAQNLEVGYNIFYQDQDSTKNLSEFSSSSINLTSHLNTSGNPSNFVSNPSLVSSSDLHINSGSPAINAGDPNFTTSPEYWYHASYAVDIDKIQD